MIHWIVTWVPIFLFVLCVAIFLGVLVRVNTKANRIIAEKRRSGGSVRKLGRS